MNLAICGAGQYGSVAKEIAEKTGVFSKIDFFDDNSDMAVGTFKDLQISKYDAVVVAIGDPHIRCKLLESIDKTVTLIDPQAIIMPSAKIGTGAIIEAGAVVCSNTVIGKGCIIMANAVVGHNSCVGEYCHLKYNSSVDDGCTVPPKTRIGCNQTYISKCK